MRRRGPLVRYGSEPGQGDRNAGWAVRPGRVSLELLLRGAPMRVPLVSQFTKLGHECVVVALSLIPLRAGDRLSRTVRLPV